MLVLFYLYISVVSHISQRLSKSAISCCILKLWNKTTFGQNELTLADRVGDERSRSESGNKLLALSAYAWSSMAYAIKLWADVCNRTQSDVVNAEWFFFRWATFLWHILGRKICPKAFLYFFLEFNNYTWYKLI